MEPFKTLTLSEARHQMNTLPKQLKADPEPILVVHQDEPQMVIVSLEFMGTFMAAVQFISDSGLDEQFKSYLESLDMEEDEVFEEETAALNPENFETEEEYYAALTKHLQEDDGFRQEFTENLQRRRELLSQLSQTLEKQEALLQSL